MSEEFKEVSFNFQNKRFVVTGASSGIGRQIVKELADAGAVVLALARREEKLKQLAEEYPDKIMTKATDVTDTVQLESAVSDFAKDGKINGSVHAAGFYEAVPLKVIRKQNAQKMFDTNLLSGIELVRIATQKKNAAAGASHVQICSASSLRGEAGSTIYCATKSAIIGAVRSMAIELARQNIRYNCVSPGWVAETDMTAKIPKEITEEIIAKYPLRVGTASDVAGMVLFLLSDKASWITGTNIVVDGGYLA